MKKDAANMISEEGRSQRDLSNQGREPNSSSAPMARSVGE
jgi:hypothetical protein